MARFFPFMLLAVIAYGVTVAAMGVPLSRELLSIGLPSGGAFELTVSELLLETFTSTGSSGISRACDQGGRSEHKEGRAFDWSALVDDEDDAQAASQVIGWLLATD